MADAEFTLRLVDAVTRPMRKIKTATIQATRAFRGLDGAGGRGIQRGLNDTAGAAENAAGSMRRLGRTGAPLDELARGPLKNIAIGLGLVGAAAGVALGALVFKLGDATIAAARFAQESRLALTLLTGSAETAGKEFDEVRRMSARLGLDVKDTQKSFQKLLAAQFKIGEAKNILRMGSDLQAIGASADEVSRAVLAITQIKSKGRVQSEELLQLQEAGVGRGLVLEALEKSLGKSRDDIQKMLETGKIDADTGIAAIIAAVQKKTGTTKLGQAGEKFADTTITGFMNKLRGGLTNAFIDMGEAITPSLNAIVESASGTLARLSESGKLDELQAKLVGAFTDFFTWVNDNWPTIESTIIGTIDLIIAGIDAANATITWMQDNWATIKTILLGIAVVLGVLAVGGALLVAPFLIAATAILGIVAAIAWVIGWIVENAASLYDAAKGWASNLITGLTDGIREFASGAIETVSGFAASIGNAFKSALGIASPSKEFAWMGAMLGTGLVVGIEGQTAAVEGATADLGVSAFSGIDGASSSGGGATSTGDIIVNVNVGGAPEGASSEQFALDIAGAVRRELQSVFDGIAEQGA